MKPFWDALQEYRELKPANTKIRQLSGEHRRAIQRLQGVQPAKVCTFCAGPCGGRRTKWCGEKCLNNYWVTCGYVSFTEAVVKQRDKEVCQMCGLDLNNLLEDFYSESVVEFERAARKLDGYIPNNLILDAYDIVNASKVWQWLSRNRLWQIDHILQVSEGGGCGYGDDFGLSNLRCLCNKCHRHVSAQATKKRALEKREKSKK